MKNLLWNLHKKNLFASRKVFLNCLNKYYSKIIFYIFLFKKSAVAEKPLFINSCFGEKMPRNFVLI